MDAKELRLRRVVFVGLGSRGDVQPLAVIAARLVAEGGAHSVLVTHRELEAVVAAVAPSLELRLIDAPCFLGDHHDLTRPLCVVDTEGRRRREWVAVTKLARDADVLVANLFSLPPCIHLAEKIAVPIVVCTPCLVPYACPDGFEAAFRDEMPELSAALDREMLCITWDDIKSWLWPLWTHRHGLFREHYLQLPTCPLIDATGAAEDTWAKRPHGEPAFIVGVDSRFVEVGREMCSAAVETTGEGEGAATAAEPSPPRRWALPQRSRVVGFWSQPIAPSPTKLDLDFAEPPVFVSFGQMVGLLGEADSLSLLTAVRDAVRACGKPAAVQWPHWIDDPGTMVRLPSDVPHAALLPQCCAAIHHGGIGTVAACLRAGLPQVIHPLAFDQPYNAAVVDRLGVGVAAPELSDIGPALARALEAAISERASAWAADTTHSDPVGDACAVIRERLDGGLGSVDSGVHRRGGGVSAHGDADLGTTTLRRAVVCKLGDGMEVRAPSASEAAWVHNEIFTDRCYTPPGIRVWPGMTCVDVGGGVGLFALFALKVLRASAITTIEPAPVSFGLCVGNLAGHLGEAPPAVADGVATLRNGSIRVHNVAADAAARKGSMLFFPWLPSNACLTEHAEAKRAHLRADGALNPEIAEYLLDGEEEVGVECLALSELLPAKSVSLLKVDVEGHEAAVLAGVADADWPRIQQVAMEIHSDALLAVCTQLLSRHYCTVWHVKQDIPGHWLLYATRDPKRLPTSPAADTPR
eukprot:m.13120 g.13120  ORF g.13120 m.13120 type:complete len:752 (-) comp4619_c0_seq1:78-2333(-)